MAPCSLPLHVLFQEQSGSETIYLRLLLNISGNNEDGEFAFTDAKKLLGNVDIDQRYCNKRRTDNVIMDNILIFEFRDDFLSDGSKLNKCISKMSNGKACHTWMGPLLVTKVKEFEICKTCEIFPK